MDENDRITIRQYVDILFTAHDRIHLAQHEQLKLQAVEYERRLGELNHAHEKAQQDKIDFVSRSVYTSEQKDIRSLIHKLEADISKAVVESADATKDIARLSSTLTWLTRTVVGAVLLAIIAVILRALANPIPVPGAG